MFPPSTTYGGSPQYLALTDTPNHIALPQCRLRNTPSEQGWYLQSEGIREGRIEEETFYLCVEKYALYMQSRGSFSYKRNGMSQVSGRMETEKQSLTQ